MANEKFKRKWNGIGMLAKPGKLDEKTQKITPAVLNYVFSAVLAIYDKINGFISLGNGEHGSQTGNLDGQYIRHTFVVANSNESIPHRLGFLPTGYIVVRKDRACDIYDTDGGSWTDSLVMLKCNTAGATVTLILY